MKRELAILGFFFSGTLWYTYPLVTGLESLVTDLADPLLNAWALSFVVHRLPVDPLGLFDANIFHPETGTLAFSEHLLGVALLVSPIEAIFGEPVLTHNAALVGLIALSGYSVHRLVLGQTGSRVAGVIAGSFFAFLPYRLGHLSHVQLQATVFLPLVFLALIRYRDTLDRRWLFAFGASLWLTSASCGYYGVFTWILLAIGAPYALSRSRRAAAGVLLASIATAALLLPLARPYLRLQREFGFSRPLARVERPAAKLHSYTRSKLAWHQSLGLEDANAEQTLFPGVGLLAVSALGLVALNRRNALFLIVGGFAFWASLGPQAGLYTILHSLVPGVSGLRVPARFSMFVFFAMSVLAGFGAGWLADRFRSPFRQAGLLLLAIVPLLEVQGSSLPFVRAPVDPPEALSFLAEKVGKEGAVLHLPAPYERERIHENAVYMLWSTADFRSMVNGYSGFVPPAYFEIATALETFPDETSLSLLQRNDVRYLVLHHDRYLEPTAVALKAAIDADARLVPLFEDERAALYRLRVR